MNLNEFSPPRLEEGYEAKPTPKEDNFGDTIQKMSSEAFADAWKKATEAGQLQVNADDPRIFTAFKQANKYLADMASAGMSLAEGVGGAVAGAIGETFGGSPEGEIRLARDIYSMTEAFAGSGIARGANLMDDLVESGAATASKVAARANQPGPMPEVLGSNLGNLAAPKVPYKPSGSEGTSGFGKVSNPAFLEEPWRERPYAQYNSDLNLIASFYSPLKSTIEQMPIAKEGSTGQTILAYLKKRAPNVNSSELEYSGLKLDPNQKYTREDLSRLLQYSTDDVYASLSEVRPKKSNLKSSDLSLNKAMRFSEVQPQKVVDKQQAYFEITLDSDTLPKPLVPGATTHHGERTLAHTRGSINTGPDGNYILVWELQSDPLQNIGKKYNPLENTGYGGPDTFSGLWVEERLRDLVAFDTQAAPNKKLFEDVIKKSFGPDLSKEELKKFYEEKYNIQAYGKTLGDIHKDAIRKTTVSVDEPFEDFLDEFFVELDRSATDYRKAEAALEKNEIPFTTNTQYVKNLLTSLIARAKKDGISKIVIPSIQEIARQRADSFEGGIDGAIKALKPTYVNAVNKAINILNSEGKGKINVGTRNLQYPDLTQKNSLRNSVATELDISGFDFDAEKQRVRFSKGGMVEDNQMQKLFEEGGMTDDGMSREPVTGNEVPPGSLAKEVRDDIPARLSEGEYVIPADVVRFFGVKFFEDLRMQAKKGLSDMDKDGRIGGTPAAPEGEDEALTPEEEQMLREALGGGELQMAEGGVVQPFDRTQFTVGNTSGFQTRKYINPKTKEERSFSFINGMPLGSVPEGFIPYTEEAAKVEDVKPSEGALSVTPVQEGGEGRDMADANKDNSQSGYAGWAEANRDAIMADPLGFGLSALEGLEGRSSKGIGAAIGGGLGGLPGAMLGGAVDLARMGNVISDARAALAQLDPTSQGYKDLDSKIKETISSLPTAQKTAINMGVVATGKAKINALNDVLTGGNFEYDYAKDISPSTRAVTGGFAPPPSRPGSFSSAPPSRPSSPSGTPSGGTPSAGPSASASAPSRGGDDRSAGGYGVDARAEGGLMMKPKKAKAKSKGLAGKQ
jgi:hypothetical protein